MNLRALIKAWDEFFFKPVSPLPVALFRIAFGTLIVIMLLTESMPDWDFWYGPRSPVQTDNLRDNFFRCPVFDLLDIVPPHMVHDTMWIVLAAAVFFTIGLFTRASSLFVWMALTTLDHHNPWNISGSDDFMRLTSFCMIFAHSGARLSVDSWWRKNIAKEALPEKIPPLGQRMVQLQLALAYWGASTAKLGGQQWADGVAVYFSSHYEDFFRLPVGHLFDSLLVCQLFSWSTLIVEVSLWSLVWFKELRYWVLLAGLLLHIGIDYTMTLPIFEMQFVAAYLTFIYPEDYAKFGCWLKRISSKRHGVSLQITAPIPPSLQTAPDTAGKMATDATSADSTGVAS